MAGFELREWIACSPQQLFELITDTKRAPELVPAVTQMEKVTEGPVGVGTRYRETRVINGRPQTSELEIVRYDPPNGYAMRNITSSIETVYDYRLDPEEQGVRVTLKATVSGSGLKALMTPLVALILKREDGDHLERVKAVAESN